jgi:hypothetical protein
MDKCRFIETSVVTRRAVRATCTQLRLARFARPCVTAPICQLFRQLRVGAFIANFEPIAKCRLSGSASITAVLFAAVRA